MLKNLRWEMPENQFLKTRKSRRLRNPMNPSHKRQSLPRSLFRSRPGNQRNQQPALMSLRLTIKRPMYQIKILSPNTRSLPNQKKWRPDKDRRLPNQINSRKKPARMERHIRRILLRKTPSNASRNKPKQTRTQKMPVKRKTGMALRSIKITPKKIKNQRPRGCLRVSAILPCGYTTM